MRLVTFEVYISGAPSPASIVHINPDMVSSVEPYSNNPKSERTYIFTTMKMYLVKGNLPFVIERLLNNGGMQDTKL
jgi:hypothetical protein